LGTSIVKTYYCDDFEKVTGGCPVPIVIAGGPKLETDFDVFKLVYEALEKGAVGVDMGRNIWQHDYPIPMIKAIRAIVHENATAKEANELFNKLKKEKK
jgi:putative autoinducer-2 (AI-2) aldolase